MSGDPFMDKSLRLSLDQEVYSSHFLLLVQSRYFKQRRYDVSQNAFLLLKIPALRAFAITNGTLVLVYNVFIQQRAFWRTPYSFIHLLSYSCISFGLISDRQGFYNRSPVMVVGSITILHVVACGVDRLSRPSRVIDKSSSNFGCFYDQVINFLTAVSPCHIQCVETVSCGNHWV